MARPSDCIYCGAETGSREHTFPASLGGRRMNKGILCGPCNGGFSLLDGLLASQLQVINGLIGVRPDRADSPKPARIVTPEGTLEVDHSGKPAFGAPRLVAEKPLDDGRRLVSMEFSTERQVQEWLAEQRAAGRDVKQIRRAEKQRFFAPIPVEWSFGGADAFREISRIALNFLAHHFPGLARSPELRQFKDFVKGTRILAPGELRYAWYAEEGAWPLPTPAFSFGHQVLLRCDHASGEVYARVRFFGTFDLFVRFGQIDGAPDASVLVDIDPLAEHPPDDLRVTHIDADPLPITITPPVDDSAAGVADLLERRSRELLSRVETRQWELGTAGLLDQINSTQDLSCADRADRIAPLLEPHLGRVLLLARHIVAQAKQRAGLGNVEAAFLATQLEELIAPDATSVDGLSALARASLRLALDHLASVIAMELDRGPMTDANLRLLLEGGPGAAEVLRVLAQQVVGALERMT